MFIAGILAFHHLRYDHVFQDGCLVRFVSDFLCDVRSRIVNYLAANENCGVASVVPLR